MQHEFERQTCLLLPKVLRVARALTHHRADADDLVQETYLKAFRAYRRDRGPSPDGVQAWIFRILLNTHRDQYRRRERWHQVGLSAKSNDGSSNIVALSPSGEPGPEAVLEHKRFIAALDRALATLPDEVRVVVVLFFIQDFTYRQIADIVDRPIGTVMSQLARGRQLLKSQLAKHLDPQGGLRHEPPPLRPAKIPSNGA
jgi:RNA polymerase sigma-70 factor (ECF subfamily)